MDQVEGTKTGGPPFTLSHQIQRPLSGFGSPPAVSSPRRKGLTLHLSSSEEVEKNTTCRTKMSFENQQALLHKHCLHKHVMNEFVQSAQKEKIRADCATPHRMISWFRSAAAEARW